MGETLWAPGPQQGPDPALPASARDIVAAVRAGTAGAMFPPVARPGPDGTVTLDRYLCGAHHARLIAAALAEPRFAPVVRTLDRVDRWCREARGRAADNVAPGVLALTNGDLFGPLVSEVFVACAAGDPGHTDQFAARQSDQYLTALTLFLRRLDTDLRDAWPDDPALSGPVLALRAHDGETHNGRQRVLRVDLAGGGTVAYKPRPPMGEMLFLAAPDTARPVSVFDLLNHLPPASGAVHLPVLRCWGGPGHLWQEWVEPPTQWGTVREDGGWRMTGPHLSPAESSRYWHRVGALVAVCYGYGIADLLDGNVLVGRRAGSVEPLLYPVDLEVFFAPLRRLHDTSLVYSPEVPDGQHHVGLESTARWCSLDTPPVCWLDTPGRALRLVRQDRPALRRETRTVVADTAGRTGYGPYLGAMLRGVFDGWTALCRHRVRLTAAVRAAGESRYVRVIRRPTATYYRSLVDHWLSGGAVPVSAGDRGRLFDADELDQMRRMDVPYFLRSVQGGPLLKLATPAESTELSTVQVAEAPDQWPPVAAVRDGTHLDLSTLGVVLRDVVEQVFDDLTDHRQLDDTHAVRWDLTAATHGQVSFDWPAARRRFRYTWHGDRVRLSIDPLPTVVRPAAADAVRQRLLRLNRVDSQLRQRWTDSAFTDADLAARLRRLTDSAAGWLRVVIERHGWPGHTTVGAEAAAAASRLVQHSEDQEFQHYCLRHMRAAAASGEVALAEVAAVVDAVRVSAGQPQVYGTKFRRAGDQFRPFPIADAEHVDQRRQSMGMEPLADYAETVRRRFAPTSAELP